MYFRRQHNLVVADVLEQPLCLKMLLAGHWVLEQSCNLVMCVQCNIIFLTSS